MHQTTTPFLQVQVTSHPHSLRTVNEDGDGVMEVNNRPSSSSATQSGPGAMEMGQKEREEVSPVSLPSDFEWL